MLAVMTSDEQLVEAYAREGDSGAFQALVERHFEGAYRLAFRMLGDPAAADDATQEAFIGLLRGARRFDGERAFQPWFTTILLNAIRAERRRQGTRARYEAAAAPANVAAKAPAEVSEAREVEEHLRRLPEELQAALVLRFYEGESQEGVAERLGMSRATAARRIEAGLARMRSSLVAAGLAGLATLIPERLEAAALEAPAVAVPKAPQLSALMAGAAKATAGALLLQAGLATALILGASLGLGALLLSPPLKAAKAPTPPRTPRPLTPAQSPRPWVPPVELQEAPEPQEAPVPGGPAPAEAPAEGEAAAAPATPSEPAEAPEAREGKGSQSLILHRWSDDFLEAVPRGELSAEDHRIWAALTCQRCTVDARGVTLSDALDELAWEGRLPIVLSARMRGRLADEEPAVSLRLKGISLKNALQLLLSVLDDTRFEVEDGAIHVFDAREREAPALGAVAAVERFSPIPDWRVTCDQLLATRRVTCDFKDTPLSDILSFLQDITGLNLNLSREVDGSAPVTWEAQDRVLGELLEEMLAPLELGVAYGNESLQVLPLAEARRLREADAAERARRESVLAVLNARLTSSARGLDLAELARLITAQTGVPARLAAPGERGSARLAAQEGETLLAVLGRVNELTGGGWVVEREGERLGLVLPRPKATLLTERIQRLRGRVRAAFEGESLERWRSLEDEAAQAALTLEAALDAAMEPASRAPKAALAEARRRLWTLELDLWLAADAQRDEDRLARPGAWLEVNELAALCEALGFSHGDMALSQLEAFMTRPAELPEGEHPGAQMLLKDR